MISMTIHAGHAPSGGLGCGAVGYLDESKEAREVVRHFMDIMKDRTEFSVKDVTVTENMSQNEVLDKLVNRINEAHANINLSIHLNAGGGCRVESWCYSHNSDINPLATTISASISKALKIAWKQNQYNNKLAVLRRTVVPVAIVECTFVDNKVAYQQWDARKCAEAIVEALYKYFGMNMEDIGDPNVDTYDNDFLYKVQMGAFRNKSNAEKLKIELERSGYKPIIKKEEV